MLNSRRNDELLTRYLLGNLPEDEAERIDEKSVTDDETAARLRSVENDLVDAYVRGDLPGRTRERFRSAYLTSPRRREKVMIAEALRAAGEKRMAGSSALRAPRRPLFASPLVPRLIFIVFMVVAAGLAGYLAIRLDRKQPDRPASTPSVERESPPVATMAPPPQPTKSSDSPAVAVSFVLMPPTRSAGPVEALSIPAEATVVTLRLRLESDDFPNYRAALHDLANDEVVWRSGELKPTSESQRSTVALDIPRSLLTAKTWSVELSGVPDRGEPESIGSYTFRVLLH